MLHTTSPSALSRRAILFAVALAPLAHGAQAQASPALGGDLARARAKLDACLDLLAQTAQIGAGWRRYLAEVSLERGPTGKEIRLGGLIAPADAAREIAAALQEAGRQPAWPEIDSGVKSLARLYGEAAPVVSAAMTEFARNAHREDEGRTARAHHERMREHMQPLVATRAELQRQVESLRAELEIAELAAWEKSGGRNWRWHMRRAVVEARRVMATMPEKPGPVDVAKLDAALTHYETIVADAEAFEKEKPGALMAFSTSPRGFLTGMRTVETRIRAVPGGTPLALPPYLAHAQASYENIAKLADAFLRTPR